MYAVSRDCQTMLRYYPPRGRWANKKKRGNAHKLRDCRARVQLVAARGSGVIARNERLSRVSYSVITLLRAFLTPCRDLYEYALKNPHRAEKVSDGSVRNWPCLRAPNAASLPLRAKTPVGQLTPRLFADLHRRRYCLAVIRDLRSSSVFVRKPSANARRP